MMKMRRALIALLAFASFTCGTAFAQKLSGKTDPHHRCLWRPVGQLI